MKPGSRLNLPVSSAIKQPKKLRGPLMTPLVKNVNGLTLRCARGRDKPTHFSRSHVGASPPGTDVTCNRSGG